jgi:membrane-bound serine protease (ClpP class)
VEEILLNPNVAYLLLVAGVMLAIMSLLSPGSGMFEVGALFALLLAGWGVYNLPVNYWALLLLLGGVFPFFLAVRKSRRLIYLAFSLITLVIGSTFLFRGEGWQPAVHPLLALVVSTLTSGFLWIAVVKSLEASLAPPDHDLTKLIGSCGEAKSDIHLEGAVQVAGELWSAQSVALIQNGTTVRVIGREGFTLLVEPVK